MAELIVLMGPTGAGKSVQGDLLAQELNGVHLSSGSLLRKDPVAVEMMASGKLLPAEDVERIVAEALAAVPAEQPIILDGFPRTMSNIRWMEQNLAGLGRVVKAVVLIELDMATITQRLGLRDRADDTPAAVQEKWDEYMTKTRPVVEYYDKLGLTRRVDGRGDVPTVQALVKAAL